MTGMRVMPITTVSGPASRDEGVVMPWLMWCSGLAESSSPLMTATGPARRETHGPHEAASPLLSPTRDPATTFTTLFSLGQNLLEEYH